MRSRLILMLTLAALGLGGCANPQGPQANCFTSDIPAKAKACQFRLMPGADA